MHGMANYPNPQLLFNITNLELFSFEAVTKRLIVLTYKPCQSMEIVRTVRTISTTSNDFVTELPERQNSQHNIWKTEAIPSNVPESNSKVQPGNYRKAVRKDEN